MERKPKNVGKKIVLTGGHAATTALSVVEELIRRSSNKLNWDIYWIGTKKAMEGKPIPTLESEVFPKMDVKHHFILAGRLQRKFTLWTIPSIAKIPLGFIHAFLLLRKIRPDVVLSFGGFAAFPVVVVGWLLRIPIIIHEQTMGAGRANKFSSFFASKIALARKSSLKHFPSKKCVLTGNPTLTQFNDVSVKNKIGSPPTIYVAGGSRGAQFINDLIEETLDELLKDYFIVHIVGPSDYQEFKKIKRKLNKDLSKRYELHSRINPMQLDGVYRRADIIVARSGANTTAEIMITKRPAILIPLYISSKTDQPANAEMARRYGIARVLKQEGLTKDVLLREIEDVKRNWNSIVEKVKNKKSPDINAAEKLVDLVEDIVK